MQDRDERTRVRNYLKSEALGHALGLVLSWGFVGVRARYRSLKNPGSIGIDDLKLVTELRFGDIF